MSPRYGFFPASTADYTRGQEPELARRLGRLGRALKLHLIGISGYRSPAHSVEVGGFADDPHTRGQASDTPGIEGVPESTLHRFGLTRPFAGTREADHIQLLKGGTMRPARDTHTHTLAETWIQAGGRRNLAPIMAAIAMAESGGRVDAVSPPNTDGSVDRGAWQINSVHTQFDPARLTSDLLYNARAAVAIERSQGLGAWTTYSSGAYQSFLGTGRSPLPTFGRTRPGGEQPGGASGDGGGEFDTIFASYTEDASLIEKVPGVLFPETKLLPFDPLKIFTDPAKAIKDTTSFLKWIGWVFHPRNILRAVEFVTGLTIMGIGIQSMIAVWRDAPEDAAIARGGRAAKSGAKTAATATPVGRAVKMRKAAQFGKRAARAKSGAQKAQEVSRKARVGESKRLNERHAQRARRKPLTKREREDIPF